MGTMRAEGRRVFGDKLQGEAAEARARTVIGICPNLQDRCGIGLQKRTRREYLGLMRNFLTWFARFASDLHCQTHNIVVEVFIGETKIPGLDVPAHCAHKCGFNLFKGRNYWRDVQSRAITHYGLEPCHKII